MDISQLSLADRKLIDIVAKSVRGEDNYMQRIETEDAPLIFTAETVPDVDFGRTCWFDQGTRVIRGPWILYRDIRSTDYVPPGSFGLLDCGDFRVIIPDDNNVRASTIIMEALEQSDNLPFFDSLGGSQPQMESIPLRRSEPEPNSR